MCTYKILTHGYNGYILQYPKCGHLQLCFGTSLIHFNSSQYTDFLSLAKEQHLYFKDNGFPNHKAIHLPTFAGSSEMILSFVELELLLDMINEANIVLEVEAILDEAATK